MSQNNKSEIVSIAKGIGIILMVIGHSGCPPYLHDFIYVFHMPLFFFISGYCFKEKYLYNVKGFCFRRLKGLYIPFVKYSLLFLLLHNIFYSIKVYNSYYNLNEILDRTIHIVFSMTGNDALLGGYWFLRVLLYSSICSLFLIKYIKKLKYLIAGVTFCSFLFSLAQLRVPFIGNVSLVLFATSLFLVGVLFQKYNFNKWYTSSVGILFCFFCVSVDSLYFNTEMLKYTYKEFIPFWISSIWGILMILGLCCRIKGYIKEFLLWVGKNTLSILTWHFICFKFVSLLIIYIYDIPAELLANFPIINEYANNGWWIIYSISGIIIPLKFTYLLNLCKKYY